MPLFTRCEGLNTLKNSRDILYTHLDVEISSDPHFCLFSARAAKLEKKLVQVVEEADEEMEEVTLWLNRFQKTILCRITSSVVQDDTLFRYNSSYVK